ncbi:MAG: permease [Patescibacteria group bacterium]
MFKSIAQFIVSYLPLTGRIAEVVEYWFYNNLKILFILGFVIFIIAFLRTYFPPEKIRNYLKGKKSIVGYFLASGLGIISPFCSCSTIPIFLGLVSAGIPFGIIITFLFVSPMVNLAAIIVLFGTLGLKFTLAYLIGGITVAVLGSILLTKLGMEKHLINFDLGSTDIEMEEVKLTIKERLKSAYEDGLSILKQILPYVLLGVTVGALIHGLVPETIIADYLSGPFSVPGAVIVGVPVYTDIMGVIPVAESLIAKGLPVGTAVAFMMSVAALSFPQFILLKKAMKKKLLFYYGGVLSLGIIVLGVFLNFIL